MFDTFVLSTLLFAVVYLMALPAAFAVVVFMRRVEKHASTASYGNQQIVVAGQGTGSITITSLEGYYAAGVHRFKGTVIRYPDKLMVFTDDPVMFPYRSGDIDDLVRLLGNNTPIESKDLLCPDERFFLQSQDTRFRKGYQFYTPHGYDECFRELYGYRPSGAYAAIVRYFIRRPEAAPLFTAIGMIIFGGGMYALGAYLVAHYLRPVLG